MRKRYRIRYSPLYSYAWFDLYAEGDSAASCYLSALIFYLLTFTTPAAAGVFFIFFRKRSDSHES